MSAASQSFRAEVRQLLDIVIHSLYTDREIFIRELVSNASDAIEKLRHLELTGSKNIFDDTLPLEINITTDDTAKTITIADYGVGMTRDELEENLGTIAHSGTKAFLEALKEAGGTAPASLIGKFGVGFYSAFMVARIVRVFTHSWRPEAEHLVWSSDGAGGYSIDEAPGQRRGCKIVIELKDDAAEFASKHTVRRVLEKYSNFVPFPINLNGERVNKVEALWLRNKSEITDAQYAEFYKFACHAWDEPRDRLHFSIDAPLQINALLFIPTENPERFGLGQTDPGVALYCRRVLIDAHPHNFLPEWLRFLRGVVDSEDIPLNISRESMQDSALVRKVGDIITGRFLKFLDQKLSGQPEKYEPFYNEFSRFLKEGASSDLRHRESLAKLLRFESSMTDPGKLTGLADYKSRMKDGQEHVFHQVGPGRTAIEEGPYIEAFKARGIEVLFASDPLDDYVFNSLREFEGKTFMSVECEDVKLDAVPDESAGEPLPEADAAALCAWLKDALGSPVSDVAPSRRLVGHPVVALTPANTPSPHLRAVLRAMRQEVDPVHVRLEINTRHPLIKNLSGARESNPDLARLIAAQLLDNALLAAGLLENGRDMVKRLNDIMARALD
jgi:TNF receptor-associated protein 1